jgi:hypothetical protein
VSIGVIVTGIASGYASHLVAAPPKVIIVTPDRIAMGMAILVAVGNIAADAFYSCRMDRTLQQYRADIQSERKADYLTLSNHLFTWQTSHYDVEHKFFRETIISDYKKLKEELDILKKRLDEYEDREQA